MAWPTLLTAEFLAGKMAPGSRLRLLDATWFLPNSPFAGPPNTTAMLEFGRRRIPGAAFFDVDALTDDEFSAAPHNLPSPEMMKGAMKGLGVHPESRVVCYDQHGLFSSPRAWYTLKAYGHPNVHVLDGGLPAWSAAGLPIVSDEEDSKEDVQVPFVDWNKNSSMQWSIQQMRDNLESQAAQHVDARPSGRFRGEVPEPRLGIRGGHAPGSLNLPFGELLQTEDGVTTMRSADEISAAFDAAGVDVRKPMVLSCGSGMSACVLSLALDRVGVHDTPVYDGSWTEWGAMSDTPILVSNEDGSESVVP